MVECGRRVSAASQTISRSRIIELNCNWAVSEALIDWALNGSVASKQGTGWRPDSSEFVVTAACLHENEKRINSALILPPCSAPLRTSDLSQAVLTV